MNTPDIATRKEADRLRDEIKVAEPAYTMEPGGVCLDERSWRLQQFKANRLFLVETRLIRAASKMRRDSMQPYQRSFER